MQAIIDLLNEAADVDPAAMYALIEARVPCNRALADHPTVQVRADENGATTVGFLGLLNGVAGRNGLVVTANVDDERRLVQSFTVSEAG